MTRLPESLRPLYPFTPRSFQTPHDARMSYVDEGGGGREAVLMLHGNPTWSFYYRELIQALSPEIRCIAPDHVGMGLSEKPEDYPYTLASRIADVAALVRALGLTKVHLVVHDWGGAIGCGLALRDPGLIGRIVILNTAAFLSPRIPRRIALCKTKFPGTAIVRGLNGFAGPAVWMAMKRRELTAEERAGFLLPYDRWANRVAVNAFVKDIPMSSKHESRETLSAIDHGLHRLAAHPMQIIWGGEDFCFDDGFYREWRRRFPQAEAHYLTDAGHYVLADANAEVIPLARGFLLAKQGSEGRQHPASNL